MGPAIYGGSASGQARNSLEWLPFAFGLLGPLSSSTSSDPRLGALGFIWGNVLSRVDGSLTLLLTGVP
jgi:hypothetical protein